MALFYAYSGLVVIEVQMKYSTVATAAVNVKLRTHIIPSVLSFKSSVGYQVLPRPFNIICRKECGRTLAVHYNLWIRRLTDAKKVKIKNSIFGYSLYAAAGFRGRDLSLIKILFVSNNYCY